MKRLAAVGLAVTAACTPHHHRSRPALDGVDTITVDRDEQPRASRSATRPVTADTVRVAPAATPGPGKNTIPTPPVSTHGRRGETTSTVTGPGVRVTSTAYCLTGRTATGHPARRGGAASNRWPLGTHLHILELNQTVVIDDRVGHGSDLDLAMPGDCPAAVRYGRRTVTVQEVPA